MLNKRKICIVTGTRAEYDLLKNLIHEINRDKYLELQIIVTGAHLSPEFGFTVNNILQDGIRIDRQVEILMSSDTPVGMSKSMGLGLIGFADVFNDLKPDLLLILGDRYEVFSAATAATLLHLPIAHLYGGERTEGAIDEAIRHSITKMSHLHFVGAEEYRKRVIQLGENPNSVFTVGGLGVDSIKSIKLLRRDELESELKIKFKPKSLLITFHPVTLEPKQAEAQMNQLLLALDDLEDTTLIFTMPNADAGSRTIMAMIQTFIAKRPNASVFTSLGQLRYLSCIKEVDAVVGNSSSGLAEVPSFKKATVNIGDRQRGRLQATSVINCEPSKKDILRALEMIYSSEFKSKLKITVNPYGDGGTAKKIVKILKNVSLDSILKKCFYDL